MITAKEAREISGPDASDYLEFIEAEIRKAAEKQKKQVIIKENPYAGWLYNEKELNPEPAKAVKTLRDNGFQVRLYYAEYQFVDMGLEINW